MPNFNSLFLRLRLDRTVRVQCFVYVLLALTPLIAGCSQKGMAQTATATAEANASASPQATPMGEATQLATAQPETPSARPTPADPVSLFNVFEFILSPQALVKRDALQLDNNSTPEMLLTLSQPSTAENRVTDETDSFVTVIGYDSARFLWEPLWASDVVSGTASPLPAANRNDGYNGGKLLRTNDPIFLLRTTKLDGHAHLYMWRWDTASRKGERLKMVPVGGGAERDSDFEADLDVTVADLDSDGTYEVVADNVSGVQVWKWDGSKYAPEVKR